MTAATTAEPAESSGKSPDLLIAMMFMFAAGFMQQLDATIVNVALPFMQGGLQAGRDQITWVLTSYIVATAIATAPTAALTARIGRKTLFQICVVGFTVASVLCGLAADLPQIVVFRLLQGAFSGPLIPIGYAILLDNYRGYARNKMVAIYGAVMMLGSVAGPTLGGYITESLSWRWNFFLNIPFGVVIFAGVARFFEDTADARTPGPFDTFGFVTFCVGVGVLQLMFDRGPGLDWFGSTEILVEAMIAAVAFYLFGVHMLTSKIRFVPPAMFRDLNYTLGLGLSTVNVALSFASTAMLPLYLQDLGGRSVFETGLILSPRGIGAIIGAFGGVRLVALADVRSVLMAAWAMTAWSLWEFAHWTPEIGVAAIVVISLVQGFALTVLGAVTTSFSFATLPPNLTNEGTALNLLIRNVGSAMLISITATILVSGTQRMHEVFSEQATPANPNFSHGSPGLFWNLGFPTTLGELNRVVTFNAELVSYSNSFMLLFWISCIIPFAGLFIRKAHTRGARQAVTHIE